ncbi:MAG TPA: aminodeoxychorismate/anthranilate synthase component II [Caulobacterales bacterium]|nr:aminodeoxychorismate/anthranilate synthase component II [Caulobacterales bacterium]
MILVIDNYDSFVYNLVDYIETLGAPTKVVRNDAMTAAAALALNPDAIVLSPGPCTPNEAGVCLDLLKTAPESLPILGVCLGHQAIGQAFGGEVVSAKAIMHGKISRVRNNGGGLFAGLPGEFNATRYHSLAVRPETLPAALVADAHTEDGEIMGMHHATRPIFGLQFHPESIASEHGYDLLRAFLRQAKAIA